MASRGFTLVEALVVVAIAVILTAIGIPSFRSYIGTMNSKAAAFDLVSDLALARSEAIKRNQATTLQPLVAGDWSRGWRIQTDAGATEVRRHDALSSGLVIRAGRTTPAELVFRPNGRTGQAIDDATFGWTISALKADGTVDTEITQRCVVITPTGSARSKTGACS